jgi:hypothetical protein
MTRFAIIVRVQTSGRRETFTSSRVTSIRRRLEIEEPAPQDKKARLGVNQTPSPLHRAALIRDDRGVADRNEEEA